MKRDGFLFVVIAFAIISSFVFYLDYSKECSSVVCVAEYISTGETSSKVYDLRDSFISEIIYPFVNPVVSDDSGIQLQPSGPVIDSMDPSTIQNSVETQITISGANFVPEFAIAIRVADIPDWFPFCTFLDSTCLYLDSSTIQLTILPGLPPGDYEIEFVDISVSPFLESNIVPLVVEGPVSAIPIAPTNLVATSLASDSIQLTWQDNSNDEIGFSIERSPSGQDSFVEIDTVAADESQYVDILLTPNTYYDYRVLATNAAGSSGYSNVATGRTLHLDPVIVSISPEPVYAGAPATVVVNGINFVPEFAIQLRVVGQTNWVDWCASAPGFPSADCTYLSPTQVTFNVPSPIVGDYEVRFVNIFGILSSTGPALFSNFYSLTVEPAIIPPTINSISPNPSRNNIARTLTISGSNFDSQFAIAARVQGSTIEVPYCSYLDTGLCNWIDSSTLLLNLSQGFPAATYEISYVNLNPVPTNSVWSPIVVEATTCLDGVQTSPCANQNGVCAGSIAQCVDGEFEACTSTNYESNNPAYNINEVGLCTDGLDNDCNSEYDHVGSGNGVIKGDQDCAIRINSVVVPPTATVGANLNLVCSTDVSNVASAVDGSLNGVFCPQASSSGTNVNFNCLVSGTPGTTQTAGCLIDTNIAYNSAGDVESGAIQILASSCSGYSSSSTCELDNNCDWILACSGQQSSGAGDRCVPAGSGSYSCISGQCGATWTAGNSCASDQIPSSVSCSCVSQAPILSNINGLSTFTLPWGSDGSVTLNGQYFASDARVFIDGVSITNPLIVNPNSINFLIEAEQFAVGSHSVVVVNPTTGLSSTSLTLRFTSSPMISSVVPSVAYNNVNTLVNISGVDFDPSYIFLLNGIDLTFLTTYVDSGLIQFLVPLGGISGQFTLAVVSGDGLASSNSVPFTLNYPFDYVMATNPYMVTVAQGYSFQSEIKFDTLYDMTQEEIVVSVPNIPEATVSFVGPDRCTPSGPPPYPSCSVTIEVSIGSIGVQDYDLLLFAVSQSTGTAHQNIITLQGVIGTVTDCSNGAQDAHETCIDGGGPICAPAGFVCSFGESCSLNNDCQANPSCSPPMGLCYSSAIVPNPICSPDQDCDSVPDSLDLCPSTSTGSEVSQLNGCPVPIATEFTSASTTNFFSIPDLNNVLSLNLHTTGMGGIQYVNPLSVLRLVSGVHQAINLNDAVQISNNLISVDSVNYPELSGIATVTLEGLNYSDVTPMTRSSSSGSFTLCSSTQCDDLTYSGGTFTMRVSGFSEYSASQAQCGDSYCSLGETCSSCASDCGICSSQPSSGNGGGGGGGGGGSVRSPVATLSQCNDKLDNDGDGLIDYPSDKGCFTLQDNSEVNENPLIDNSNEGQPNNVDTPLEKVFEVRVIFWVVLIVLIGGIVGVSTMILRDLLGRKKFDQLAKMVNSSQSSSQNAASAAGI